MFSAVFLESRLPNINDSRRWRRCYCIYSRRYHAVRFVWIGLVRFTHARKSLGFETFVRRVDTSTSFLWDEESCNGSHTSSISTTATVASRKATWNPSRRLRVAGGTLEPRRNRRSSTRGSIRTIQCASATLEIRLLRTSVS